MAVKIQIRRGTAAEWTSANPTLLSGEQGLETDTGKTKIGDGVTAWNSLGYVDAKFLPTSASSGYVLNSLIDDAGDLIVGSADNTVGRLALGSDGHVLTVDTAGTGVAKVKWAAPVSGLTLIASESFSAVSSVSLNGCFSSTYQNYRIVLFTTAAQTINMRLRVSGSDASGSNYARQRALFAGSSGFFGTTTDTQFEISGNVNATTNHAITQDIFGPFAAAATLTLTITHSSQGPSATLVTAEHTLATSYDGFSFFPASGTLTGTIRVYGYRD